MEEGAAEKQEHSFLDQKQELKNLEENHKEDLDEK